jgi:tripartite-type tricarboxylate transporter receptor subunit TctC
MSFRAMALLLTAMAALLAGGHAAAQSGYPSRPITLVVPQAAGGTNDIVGRLVGQTIAEVLGASVVVDNRRSTRTRDSTRSRISAPWA